MLVVDVVKVGFYVKDYVVELNEVEGWDMIRIISIGSNVFIGVV